MANIAPWLVSSTSPRLSSSSLTSVVSDRHTKAAAATIQLMFYDMSQRSFFLVPNSVGNGGMTSRVVIDSLRLLAPSSAVVLFGI